jgi:filamentous hemagglutinin
METASVISTARASTLSGNQIVIQTGVLDDSVSNESNQLNTTGTQTTIQGSHLIGTATTFDNVGDAYDNQGNVPNDGSSQISITTGDLNILASRDTVEQKTETQHGHITAQVTVYGAAGGASISGSYDRNRQKERSSTVNNSTLNADTLALNTSNDLTLRGANIHANDHLHVNVQGDLNVESQQNKSYSRNAGFSVSGGVSLAGDAGAKGNESTANTTSSAAPNNSILGAVKNAKTTAELQPLTNSAQSANSVNGGVGVNKGMNQSKETVLTSLTSGNTATVIVDGHTQITGALLATIDENGNDLNQLDFEIITAQRQCHHLRRFE